MDRAAAVLPGAGEIWSAPADDPVALLVGTLACARTGAVAAVAAVAAPPLPRTASRADSRGRLAAAPGDGPPAGTWLWATTSGTTRAPRRVARTWASWAGCFAAFDRLTGGRVAPGARVLVPGPLTSTLFLFGAVHAACAGADVVLRPVGSAGWEVAHLVPAQLADLIDTAEAQGGGLAGRLAVVAGAALTPRLAARADRLGLDVLTYYGAAELSFVAAGPPAGLRAFPGVELQVRDGIGWARSPYLALGAADADGWASVGDRIEVDANGLVTILSRGDALILTGATVVRPEDVEDVLRTVPGVLDAAVVGTPHTRLGQLVTAVLALADPHDPAAVRTVTAQARAACRRSLTAAQRPRRWHAVAALPRAAAGKVSRVDVLAALDDLRFP